MTRRHALWILAGLWLLDGLLQLQPGMFTMAMIQAIMQPALLGQPAWLQDLLRRVVTLLSWNLVVTNIGIAAVQIGIGAALLWSRGRRWPYWASLTWAGLLWVFGQGLGTLLTGQASVLSGAPGSAVLYALLTWAAWPTAGGDAPRAEARRRTWIAAALGLLWAVNAAIQAAPAFFTPSGLSDLVLGMTGGQPGWLAHLLNWGAWTVQVRPAWTNAATVAAMAAVALGLWAGGPWRRPALALSMAVAAWSWIFGQAFGMIFTGMATDPNSAPLYAALALYAWGAPPRGLGTAAASAFRRRARLQPNARASRLSTTRSR